jgi:hypothetical protein
MKAPYWFEKEGSGYRLYEKGRKTTKTYRSIDSAKKDVLAMNDAFRASKGKMSFPRLKNGKKAELRAPTERQLRNLQEVIRLEEYLEMRERYADSDDKGIMRAKKRLRELGALTRNNPKKSGDRRAKRAVKGHQGQRYLSKMDQEMYRDLMEFGGGPEHDGPASEYEIYRKKSMQRSRALPKARK